MNLFRIAAATAVLCLAAACTTSEPEPQGCGSGQIACGTACVTPANDPANCGGCGNVCPAPTGGTAACVSGKCAAVCTAGQSSCGATFADGGQTFSCSSLLTDNQNCGTCGNVCAPQQGCSGGSCNECPQGGARCNDVCVVIQSDRSNCGGCGTACAATEVCSDSRCAPCPVAECNNVCTDTQHDPQNCGVCGTACSATQACISGKCGATIVIALQPPASGGFVPAEGGPVTVQVSSEYRLSGVTVDGPPSSDALLPDGGVNRHADLTISSSPADLNPSTWTFLFATQGFPAGVWDGGMTFTATDEDFRADAGDAALHQAQLTAFVQTETVPTGAGLVPTLAATAGSTALPAGAFIPLDSAPITLTANWSATPVGITSIAFSSSSIGTLASVPVTANAASLTIDPTLLGLGSITVQACPVDAAGDTVAAGFCSATLALTIGALPAPSALETHDSDGGHALWFMGADAGDGGASAYLLSAPADVAQPGGVPATQASDAGYFNSSLAAADTTNSVFAVRSDGTSVDRFDCAGGCRTPGFIVKNANDSVGLQQVIAVSSAAVVLTDQNNAAWVAPSASAGTAINADPSGAAATLQGSPIPVGSGGFLLVLARSVDDSGTQFEVVLYHPGAGRTQIGGNISNNAVPIVTAFPSGEFAVQYASAAAVTGIRPNIAAAGPSNALVVGYLHSGTVVQTTPKPINNINTTPDFVPAQPGVLLGTIDADSAHPGLQPFVANPTANSVTFPVAISCPTPLPAGATCTGAMAPGVVRTRLAVPDPFAFIANNTAVMGSLWQGGNFAISDDQLKALVVSEDTQGGSTIYTLWLIDLQSGTASALYASPLLVGAGTAESGNTSGIDSLAPHFVHSAAASVNIVPGKGPGTLVALPVAVWAEILDANVSQGEDVVPAAAPPVQTPYARLFYARYVAAATAPTAVAIDQLAFYDQFRPDFNVSSAAAGALYFLGVTSVGGELNLYSAPLTGTTSTATLVMDQVSNYRVREDTQRIIVGRADGTLWSGALAASTAQRAALSPVLTGTFGGLPTPNQVFNDDDYVPPMGFTPDGTHAWAFVQYGGDPWEFPSAALLQVVDLSAGARTNYGQAVYVITEGFAPVGFLGSGAVAIAYDLQSFEDNSTFRLYAAAATAGTVHVPYGSLGTNAFHFASSIDGTEGYVFDVSNNSDLVASAATVTFSVVFFASANPALYQNNYLLPVAGVAPIASQPATYSPYGMPYTDAWDVFASSTPAVVAPTVGDVAQPAAVSPVSTVVFFKTWGGTTALPPVAIANFQPSGGSQPRQLADNSELLVNFNNGISAYARRLRLNGVAVPTKPLP